MEKHEKKKGSRKGVPKIKIIITIVKKTAYIKK